MTTTFTIHTDGGARGNPGPAGIGAVFYNDQKEEVAAVSKYIGEATNNVAEYKAIIEALRHALTLGTPETLSLEVKLDSQLAERQLNGAYKVKDATLRTLYEKADELRAKFHSVNFTHVRREENKRADELANEAMDKGV